MPEYIAREAYVKYISSREKEFIDDYGKGWVSGIRAAKEIAKKFQPSDVAPVRHGRWEDVRENVSVLCETGFPMTTTAETCSACRFRSCFVGPKTLLHDGICPNCGARMDLPEGETHDT